MRYRLPGFFGPPNTSPLAQRTISPVAERGRIAGHHREIKATVKNDHSVLSREDIKLFVNDQERGRFSYDPSSGRLVFDKMRKLGVGKHSVRIEATDEAGNTAKEKRTFRIR